MVHIRYDTDGYWNLFRIGMQGHRRRRQMPNNTVQDIAPLSCRGLWSTIS